MNAIIVPGVTDLNKGDQALVWESQRLLVDTGLYENIYLLNSGDTVDEVKKLSQQTSDQGYKILENILRHPRRGKHKNTEHINESKMELIKQIINAAFDFISTKTLLLFCKNTFLIKTLFSKKTHQTIKAFNEADAIFVKGGGFIHAYGERTAPYLMWYFLFYVRLAIRLDKKVVFLPNSYGPFEGFTVKSQVRSVFKKLNLVYAREKVSASSLGKLLNKEVPVEMDLGFFLQKGEENIAVEILNKYNILPSEKIVGITIRPWRFPGLSNPEELYKNYINSVASLSKHILSKGYKIALCNQSIGPNSHEDDRNAIKDLLRLLNDSNVFWINENLNCKDLKSLYSNFYFFVGTRFHSIIFSLTSSVPSIAIGYGGNKAKGIMGDFNLDDFIIQIQDVNPESLIDMFDKAIDDYESIKLKLNSSMKLISKSRNQLILDIQSLYK
jgi:colanic acid/amylovoran biosynthesis protein